MSSSLPRPGRTFELKVLIASLLIVSLASWLRLRLAVINWDLLPELGAAASPLYLALSSGIWGLASLAAALGLYFRQRWAPNLARLACSVIAVWYWLDRILLNQNPLGGQNWPFAAVFTVLALIFAFGTLALNAQKAYFDS